MLIFEKTYIFIKKVALKKIGKNNYYTFIIYRIEVIAYEKIGTVTNKAWSDLLGDVVSGNVDIGLGYITISTERQQEMSFSYPLVKSMYVYLSFLY